jgi:hypothetical protein
MPLEILYLSIVVASISFTVADSKLCRPVRNWANKQNKFLGDMVSCGYCFGHWISFLLTAIYTPRLLHFWMPLDYFLTALIIAWLGAIQWAIFSFILEKTG